MNKLWYVIFGLVAVIVLLILFQPQPDDTKEKELQAKIDSRDQAIFQLHRENSQQAEKRKADSLRFTKSIQAGQVTIEKQSRRISDLMKNPVVIKVRDSIPEVDSAFDTYEGLIQEQNKQIELQAKYIDTLRIDLTKVEKNFQERLDLQAQTIADLKTVTDDQRKQLRKTRRTVKLLKIAGIAGTVAGIFLGGSL